jgi:hypothetical protein
MQSIARNFEKIAFVASDVPEAQEARERLAKAYGNVEPRKAEAIVALGGDGLMLQTLHRHLNDRVPIYGMNRGSTGFLMNDYSEDDLRRMYWGLGTHLGRPVFQNRSGELMRAIRDEGAHVGRTYGETKDQTGSTFLSSYARTLTNGGLRFHTDRTDVVGLLCVRQARAGGVSKLASTPAIHNAILASRPDLLDELFKDYWRSRFGEEGTTKETAYPLPIFGLRDGKFTSHYSLTFIEAAEMAPGVPKLTSAQKEAIEVLMATAEELCFEMTLEPGDLQLINSHVTYHGRTPFEDDHDAGMSRLLLRLWLTMPNNRPLPQGHEILWRSIDAGQPRGGIQQVTI